MPDETKQTDQTDDTQTDQTDDTDTSDKTEDTEQNGTTLGGKTEEGGDKSDDKSGDDEGKSKSSEEGDEAGKDGDEGGAPDEYEDFEMPEGFEKVDETFLAAGKEAFKDLNLSQEQAQKLVTMYAENLKSSVEQQASQWRETLQEWVQTAEADEEIGGDEYKENLGIALAVMDEKAGFATPELREAMNTYGFGSHPEVIRFVTRVGKVLDKNGLLPKEDRSIGGRPTATKEGDKASRMYPSMKN